MKPKESLENFDTKFVHLCARFPKGDVKWVYMSEKFQWLVLMSLQHFQYYTNLDSYEYHDNQRVTIFPDIIPNIVFPNSYNRENYQASKEEIIACESSHPPLNLLHSEILIVNGDEKYFQRNESNCLPFEALIHPFESEYKTYVDATSFPFAETKPDPVKYMPRYILGFHSLANKHLGIVSDKFAFHNISS